MDRRLRQNGVVLLLSLALFLSVWQITSGPGPPVYLQTAFNLILSNTSSNLSSYRMDSFNSSDYTQLIDLHDFSFTILNTPCNDSNILVVFLVHSAPGNFLKRKTIRETWGQAMEGMTVLFMLGMVKDAMMQKKLAQENEKYGDFVQGSFLDSYMNVTYKHAMVFKYSLYHCPQAKYLLKTDDDVFINTYNVMDFLKNEIPDGTGDLLICEQQRTPIAIRSYRSKWRVSFDEYKYKYYPTYCPGWSLLYSKDVVFRLYKELQKTKYFWIDDVLITGILFKKLNMTHVKHDTYALTSSNQNDILSNNKPISWKDFLYGNVELKADDIQKLWDIVTKDVKANNQITQTPAQS